MPEISLSFIKRADFTTRPHNLCDEPYTFYLFLNYCLCFHSLFPHLFPTPRIRNVHRKEKQNLIALFDVEPELCARKIIKCYLSLWRQRKCVSDTYKNAQGGQRGVVACAAAKEIGSIWEKIALEEIKSCI